MPSQSRYINVDLDVVGATDLAALGVFFDAHADLLHCGKEDGGQWMLTVEAAGSGLSEDVNRDIDGILGVIEQLDDVSRNLWDRCTTREFNLGFECGETRAHNTRITQRNIRRIADAGCTISVTLYPMHADEHA